MACEICAKYKNSTYCLDLYENLKKNMQLSDSNACNFITNIYQNPKSIYELCVQSVNNKILDNIDLSHCNDLYTELTGETHLEANLGENNTGIFDVIIKMLQSANLIKQFELSEVDRKYLKTSYDNSGTCNCSEGQACYNGICVCPAVAYLGVKYFNTNSVSLIYSEICNFFETMMEVIKMLLCTIIGTSYSAEMTCMQGSINCNNMDKNAICFFIQQIVKADPKSLPCTANTSFDSTKETCFNGIVIPFCKVSIDSKEQTYCEPNAICYQGSCVTSCPTDLYSYNHTCLTSCPTDLYSYNHTCVTACPVGTIAKDKSCQPCPVGTIAKDNSCQSCPVGTIVKDNSCQPCPSGTIAKDNSCQSCPPGFVICGGPIVSCCPRL